MNRITLHPPEQDATAVVGDLAGPSLLAVPLNFTKTALALPDQLEKGHGGVLLSRIEIAAATLASPRERPFTTCRECVERIRTSAEGIIPA
jgi:hypothetical protein